MLPPGATIIPIDEAKKLLAERIELNWLKGEIRRLTESKSDDAAQLVNDLELEINSEWERAQKAEAEWSALKYLQNVGAAIRAKVVNGCR